MKIIKTLVLLGLFAVLFGSYQGWFVLTSRSPASSNNKVDVSVPIAPDAVKQDVIQDDAGVKSPHQQDEEALQGEAQQDDVIRRIDANYRMTTFQG